MCVPCRMRMWLRLAGTAARARTPRRATVAEADFDPPLPVQHPGAASDAQAPSRPRVALRQGPAPPQEAVSRATRGRVRRHSMTLAELSLQSRYRKETHGGFIRC